MSVPTNPSEFRKLLTEKFAERGFKANDCVFDQAVTDDAIDELIGMMVDAYLNNTVPTACQRIVAELFMKELEE